MERAIVSILNFRGSRDGHSAWARNRSFWINREETRHDFLPLLGKQMKATRSQQETQRHGRFTFRNYYKWNPFVFTFILLILCMCYSFYWGGGIVYLCIIFCMIYFYIKSQWVQYVYYITFLSVLVHTSVVSLIYRVYTNTYFWTNANNICFYGSIRKCIIHLILNVLRFYK